MTRCILALGLVLVLVLGEAAALEHEAPKPKAWDNVNSRKVKSGETPEFELPAVQEPTQSEPYRIVNFGHLSVIYEDFAPVSDAAANIQVISFSDPRNVVPNDFRLDVSSDVRVWLEMDCDEDCEAFSVVSYFNDVIPKTEVTFNATTSTVHVSLKPNVSSDAILAQGGKVDVTIMTRPSQVRLGSGIVLNAPRSRVTYGDDTASAAARAHGCGLRKRVSVVKNYVIDVCAERSVPCHQLCRQDSGACYCHQGYIQDMERPEKCLATHLVEMAVPGLIETSSMLGLTSGQHALLLESHFGDLVDGAVHQVHVQANKVTATTVDTANTTAEEAANRLRREIVNSDGVADSDLGLATVHSIRVLTPSGLLTRQKRQTCTKLQEALDKAFSGQIFKLTALLLPVPSFDVTSLCVDAKKFISSKLSLTVSIPISDQLAKSLLPSNLVLKNTVLGFIFTPSTRSIKMTATADWMIGQSEMTLTADFDTASGSVVISGQTPKGIGLSVADLFSLIHKGASTSLGLAAARADEVGFQITFERKKPLVFFVRLFLKSAKDLARNLVAATSLRSSAIDQVLQGGNLESFDIKNIEVLITNSIDGNLTVRVNGKPVLPKLPSLDINVQIEAFNVGTLNILPKFGFSIVGNVDLLSLIDALIPNLKIPKLPGLPNIKLPDFSLGIQRPRLPGLPKLPPFPSFNLPKVRLALPSLSLPSLKLPGIRFHTTFKPTLPNLPSLSITGSLGLGPICFDFRQGDQGPAASLTTLVTSLFPDINVATLPIPSFLKDILQVQVNALCLNKTARTFTVSITYPKTIDLVPSKKDFLSLTSTTVDVTIDASTKPARFSVSATSTAKFGKFPVSVAFQKDLSGAYQFTATPVQSSITTGDIASTFGSAGADLRNALADVQLASVTLSNLKLTITKTTSIIMHFTATVSYRKLPKVSFELVVQDPFTTKSLIAIGIQTTSATLANIVSSIIPSVDISGIPFVSTVQAPALAALYINATSLTPPNIKFTGADLVKLAALPVKTKLKFLVPINFPRISRQDIVSAVKGVSFDFQVPPNTISLEAMIQKALPTINLGALAPPAGFPGLANVYLNQLKLDVPNKVFCVGAGLAGRTFELIPKFLALHHITFNVCMKKQQLATDMKLAIAGSFTLGKVTVDAKLKSSGGQLTASAYIAQRLTLPDILTAFGASFIPGGDSLAQTLRNSGFDKFGFERTTIVFNRTTTQGTSISVSGQAFLSAFTCSCEILFTGLGTKTRGVIATFELPRITLAKVVSLISGIDIAGLPVLGDIAIPGITITIANLDKIKLPTGFQFKNALVRGFAITKGAAVNFLQRLAKKVRNFRMSFKLGSFDLILTSFPTLDEALRFVFPGVGSLDVYKILPTVLPQVFHLRVTRISYDSSTKTLTTQAALDGVTIIPRLLEIKNAKVVVTITKAPSGSAGLTASGTPKGSTLSIAVHGVGVLFSLRLKLAVVYDPAQKSYALNIQSPTGKVHLKQMFKLLGSASNDAANPAIRALHLNTAEIINPLFSVNQQQKSLSFRIRGTPTIKGFNIFTMELIANTEPRQMILTMSAENFSMGKMIETLTGLSLRGIPFAGLISGPSSIGITLSANNVDKIPFPISSYPLNETTSIQRGLGFNVAFRLPADCRGDKICGFFKKILGNTAILFRVTGINGPRATVAFRMPGSLSLGSFKLFNIDFGFTVSATSPPTIGLTNIEMKVPVPKQTPLHFRGQLLIDAAFNVQARLQMIGIYQKAFGIPILAFGNIDAAFRTRIDCPICVTQLTLGGEVAIGQRCYAGNAGNCIKARAILNIDAIEAKNNFFYFKLNQFSFSKLLTAVGLPKIPALRLLDAVSVRNVEASYSLQDRNIPSGIIPGGVTIKAGLVLKGEVSLLFLVSVKVDIQVELFFGVVKSVRALLQVSPINLGPLKFTSTKSSRKGPKFDLKAYIIPKPKLYLEVDGKLQITVIGFSRSVYAKIDDTGIHVKTSGRMFGFGVSFTLKAQFKSISKPKTFKNFHLSGRFTTMGAQVASGVKNALQKASRALHSKLNSAQKHFENLDKKVKKAAEFFNLKKRFSDKRKRAFASARQAVNRAKAAVYRLCSIKNCKSCKRVPKPCIKYHCWSHGFICCRRWRCRTCRRRTCIPKPGFCGHTCIPWIDPICIAKNGACLALRGAAFLAEKTAKAGLITAESAAKVAEHATHLASTAVGKARIFSRTSKLAFDGIKGAFKGITSAINSVLSAFIIHSISFSVNISSLSNAHISAMLDVTVFGKRHRLRANINMRKIYDFAAKLAKRFYKKFF